MNSAKEGQAVLAELKHLLSTRHVEVGLLRLIGNYAVPCIKAVAGEDGVYDVDFSNVWGEVRIFIELVNMKSRVTTVAYITKVRDDQAVGVVMRTRCHDAIVVFYAMDSYPGVSLLPVCSQCKRAKLSVSPVS